MSDVRDDPPFPTFTLPGDPDAEGWIEETTRYVVRPRPKPKFRSVMPREALFGRGDGSAEMITRVRPTATEGQSALEIRTRQTLGEVVVEETFRCIRRGGGLVAESLQRRVGEGRHERVQFDGGPLPWPAPTYPEVMLPFVMRGVPRDGTRRPLYSWTNDRFVARVYVESRGKAQPLEVPAGRIAAVECWMYPDLNDWIALGRVVTRLAKPLLPRYDIHFEAEAPHRVVRFEGPYGPPGSVEVVLELAG